MFLTKGQRLHFLILIFTVFFFLVGLISLRLQINSCLEVLSSLDTKMVSLLSGDT